MATKALSVTLTEARDNLGDVVSRAAYGHERVRICRHGKAIAAVISVDDLALFEHLEDQADVAAARAALAEPGSIPWDKVKADLGL